jgi:neutral amino acid transport system permease protein
MYALANSSIQPGSYSRDFSTFIFTAMILGGAGRILGPVVGAILFSTAFVFLDNVLNQAVANNVISSSILEPTQVGQVRLFLTGALLMALMIFRPQGIFGDKKELAIDAR